MRFRIPRVPMAQSLVEYALIAALAAIPMIPVVATLNDAITGRFTQHSQSLDKVGSTDEPPTTITPDSNGAESDGDVYDEVEGDSVFAIYSADDNSVRVYGSHRGEGVPQVGTKWDGRTVTEVDYDITLLSDEFSDSAKWSATTVVVEDEVIHPGGAMLDGFTGWLEGWPSLATVDLSKMDVSRVTDMSRMFASDWSLQSVNLSGWDTSKVTGTAYMFSDCMSLTSLDATVFDTSSVTDMQGMFNGCTSLTSLDVSGFDTSNVTNMYSMFSDCMSLTSLDVSGFDVSGVGSIAYMFSGCASLTSLDVSGWDTSNITGMGYLFDGCSGLTELDLAGWDTSSATSMYRMFGDCSSLRVIHAGLAWTTAHASTVGMFDGAGVSWVTKAL